MYVATVEKFYSVYLLKTTKKLTFFVVTCCARYIYYIYIYIYIIHRLLQPSKTVYEVLRLQVM